MEKENTEALERYELMDFIKDALEKSDRYEFCFYCVDSMDVYDKKTGKHYDLIFGTFPEHEDYEKSRS